MLMYRSRKSAELGQTRHALNEVCNTFGTAIKLLEECFKEESSRNAYIQQNVDSQKYRTCLKSE